MTNSLVTSYPPTHTSRQPTFFKPWGRKPSRDQLTGYNPPTNPSIQPTFFKHRANSLQPINQSIHAANLLQSLSKPTRDPPTGYNPPTNPSLQPAWPCGSLGQTWLQPTQTYAASLTFWKSLGQTWLQPTQTHAASLTFWKSLGQTWLQPIPTHAASLAFWKSLGQTSYVPHFALTTAKR